MTKNGNIFMQKNYARRTNKMFFKFKQNRIQCFDVLVKTQ